MKLEVQIYTLIAVSLFSCVDNKIDLGPKLEYETLEVRDSSIPNRKRSTILISAPSAKSSDERGRVVMQAALDLESQTSCKFCSAFLEISKETSGSGANWASAVYSPDQLGVSGESEVKIWDVRVSDMNYPSEEELQILIDFNKDNNTEEKKLMSILAKKYNKSDAEINSIIIKYSYFEKNKFQIKNK